MALIVQLEMLGNDIGRITVKGKITEYQTLQGAIPSGLTVGRDKTMWFAEYNDGTIIRVKVK